MSETKGKNGLLFWGCFIALITTGFAFVGRLELLGVWGKEFNLDKQQLGILAGIGIWPFAVSIILFSLIIDKIGYKLAMLCAFTGHIVWAALGVAAYFVSKGGDTKTAYSMLVVGSFIAALGNGAVEAFINPVVATIYNKEKTKWLNILHAAWPGGLVLMGVIVIVLAKTMANAPWAINVGIIAVPAIIYFLMLVGLKFPVNERVSSGVSYREMLAEFGAFGALVTGTLIGLQVAIFGKETGLIDLSFRNAWLVGLVVGIISAIAMGVYTKSLGRGLMILMVIIMAPLAITEIGTDGWITEAMSSFAKSNNFPPVAVLIYTSMIMLVLRFFAGPIVKVLTPLGLLIISAVLAIIGLVWLSVAEAGILIAAATLYGLGKTFFWPTTLGIVAEQTPKGGALTLNAISGIGMLACGAIGFPLLGLFQINTHESKLLENEMVTAAVPSIVQQVDGKKKLAAVIETDGLFGKYNQIDNAKINEAVAGITDETKRAEIQKELNHIAGESPKWSLSKIAIFPVFMLICYIGLFLYFKSKGGYKPVVIGDGH